MPSILSHCPRAVPQGHMPGNGNTESSENPDTTALGRNGKESSCQFRRCKRFGFDPWVRKISLRRVWQPTLVSLPGKSHGQRSLAGYSPAGHKESGMTEQLNTHTNTIKTLSFIKRCLLFHLSYIPHVFWMLSYIYLQFFLLQGSWHSRFTYKWILNAHFLSYLWLHNKLP